MKYLIMLTSLICFQLTVSQNNIEKLSGHWEIDLRPTPIAEAYIQVLEITRVVEKTFNGTFYGSLIENAILNPDWNKLYFAFITKDTSHIYYHSGYLLNEEIYGITYCPTRNFTAPWTGLKKEKN